MTLPNASQRVAAAAAAFGLDIDIHRFPEGTKTAQDAAEAVGCALAAIVKSMVFTVDDRPVIALIPGDRRLDAAKLAAVAGGRHAARASLELVREATGFAAGGTPPIGHPRGLSVYADHHLRRHAEVWVAGGTPDTVFPIALEILIDITQATWADVS